MTTEEDCGKIGPSPNPYFVNWKAQKNPIEEWIFPMIVMTSPHKEISKEMQGQGSHVTKLQSNELLKLSCTWVGFDS